MKKPTKARIEKEISALREMKPRVMRRSGFGDDHHRAIDAQIDVLTRRLDESAVFDSYPYDPCDEEAEDQVPENVHANALEAAQWLAGESEYKTLTENWKELCRPQVPQIRPR